MDKAVIKFRQFLDGHLNDISVFICQKYYNNLKNSKKAPGDIQKSNLNLNELDIHSDEFCEFGRQHCQDELIEFGISKEIKESLDMDKETQKEINYLFDKFDKLSQLLNISNLNVKEKLDVIMYFIKKNHEQLNNGFGHYLVSANDVKEIAIKYMSRHKYNELVLNKTLTSLLNKDDEELNEEELSFKNALIKRAEEKEGGRELIIASKVINRHYCLKEDNLSEKDIEPIYKSLLLLKIDENLCKSIKGYLLNKMKKQENKTVTFVPEKKEEKVKILSVKEQNKIYREIMSMYNIDLERTVKPLNLDEIIYLVSLMYKLNVSEIKIKNAIKNIYKSYSMSYENPFVEFNAYYGKMVYLSENEDIKVALSYMKEIMQEILICDNKSYIEWKDELEKTITEVKPLLSMNIEFELEQGKNRI
jgi:hypothetical protein